MIYTIKEIKKIAIPIVKEYGIVKLSLFESYTRRETIDNSNLDFLVDSNLEKNIQRFLGR